MRRGRHRPADITPGQLDAVRIDVLERQVHDLSVANVRAGAEHRAQASIIRRKNAELATLGLLLRWLLQSYSALARARQADRPARVLDTGTPGVEVTR